MAYRDAGRACLSCSAALDDTGRRLACPVCRSCLVTMADLDDMMLAMIPQGGTRPEGLLHARVATGPGRGCPRCTRPMTARSLLGQPVDRCGTHGIWFDRDELSEVLFATRPVAGPALAPALATTAAAATTSDADGVADVVGVIDLALHVLHAILSSLP